MIRRVLCAAFTIVALWSVRLGLFADEPPGPRRGTSDQFLLSMRRRAAVRQAHKRWQRQPTQSISAVAQSRASVAVVVNETWSACPASRRPYHVLLTASAGTYQAWQTRVLFYHYTRLRRAYPCDDMNGFTRLLTTPGAKPDDMMDEIPTIVVGELNAAETMGFVVLNRPNSVRVALERGWLKFEEECALQGDGLLGVKATNATGSIGGG